MIVTKTQTVSVNINGVEFNIDIDVAIKAGIAKPVRTHKIGNYYRDIKTGVIYILVSYGGYSRVSLVFLTGIMTGYRVQTIDLPNINNTINLHNHLTRQIRIKHKLRTIIINISVIHNISNSVFHIYFNILSAFYQMSTTFFNYR